MSLDCGCHCNVADSADLITRSAELPPLGMAFSINVHGDIGHILVLMHLSSRDCNGC
jgi:hypothetical protein